METWWNLIQFKRISLKKNPAQRHLSVAISIFFQARQGKGGGVGACAQISNNSWRVVMTRLVDKRSCMLISSGSWRFKKIDLKCSAACYNITFPQRCAITKNTKWSIVHRYNGILESCNLSGMGQLFYYNL